MSPKFLPDGTRLLFLRASENNPTLSLYSFDLKTGEEAELLSPKTLLQGAEESLSPEERARRERMRVSSKGITSYEISRDGARIIVSLGGSVFSYLLATGEVQEIASKQGDEAPFDPKLSPNGEFLAFVRAGELWVTKIATQESKQLTFGANELKTHAQAEFVAQEEMDRFTGYWWSPDSTMLLYEEADATGVERLYLGDPATPAEVVPFVSYPRAGKRNVDTSFGLISVEGGETTWLRWDKGSYPYLTRVLWSENAPLSVLLSSRDQRTFELFTVDIKTGALSSLLKEEDKAWLNLSDAYRWLPDGSAFIWPTERAGAWQLVLYNKDGTLQRELTSPSLGFRGIRHLDKDKLIVAASTDPMTQSLYTIPLSGGEPTLFPVGEGFYDASFSKSGEYVLTQQSLTGPSQSEVYRSDNTKVGALKSVAKAPPAWPNVEIVKVGEKGFYSAIIRPRDFEKGKRYPVIVRVYGGPGTRTVSASASAYITDQWIADHGFFVIKIDGRGTPGRGRDWERAIHEKFSSVPLEDQVSALTALAEKEPAIDLSRVGVIGHSFGGYMAALSVLKRPDIYKAGVASAPVVDWLDYDTFYTERYLGVPEKDTRIYEENSLLKYAPELSRPLLLIHGTADDNVHFGQSLKLADALFRAEKDFELLPLVGQTHMIQGTTEQYWQRVFSFFREHL